jgi:RNA polymerase sigma-70 factor (ECF subfamily)
MAFTEDQRRGELDEEFLRLFMLNQRSLFAYILSLVPRISDAEDILQETSITLWHKRGHYHSGTNFRAWASTFAYNAVRNFRAKQTRDRLCFDDELLDRIASRTIRISDELDDRRVALADCLHKLPAQDQRLLEQRYQPGVTTKSLAGSIGRPIEGLYKVMKRIHDVLHVCVERSVRSQGGTHERI